MATPSTAPPPGLTAQPPRHARPQLQNLVHVWADGFLQGGEQLVLFRLEGAEAGGGPGQDGGVDCVEELPGPAKGTAHGPEARQRAEKGRGCGERETGTETQRDAERV